MNDTADTKGIPKWIWMPEHPDDSEPDDSREYDDEEAFDGAIGT